MALTGNRAPLP